MRQDPIILPPPTDDELRGMVDRLITPESAEKDARALIRIVTLIADETDSYKSDTARFFSRYAFSKTEFCEQAVDKAFYEWIGLPAQRKIPVTEIEPEANEIGHIG